MDESEGCTRLEIYRLAHDLAVRIHALTLTLPHFELYEEGGQIRRSSKRVVAGIVEGYALRRYRDEFLHYLYRSVGSADETQEHLRLLQETGSMRDTATIVTVRADVERLSRMLMRFVQGVEKHHSLPRFVRGARRS